MSPLPVPARIAVALLVLLCSFSSAGWAQDSSMGPGSRVRVWTGVSDKGQPRGPQITGQLITWTADSLVLDPRGAQERWTVPIISISRVEVSRGQNSRREGALRMGGIGWIVGLVAGAVLYYDEDDFLPPVLGAVASGAPIGAAGALVGAMIGASRPGERWERVAMPGRVSISPTKGQGIAFSTSLRF